jgi:hypothetical protein
MRQDFPLQQHLLRLKVFLVALGGAQSLVILLDPSTIILQHRPKAQ